ncbi:hypothetical protein L486_06429 [Kwoniella mangroviensis CBS 10435]|uniref:Bromo domain-containing protein n=1 Tax=Kwoniella mangroviensis CBS 10435 TaxID=1331196 RepID=A0A1B9IJ18_9TREE|nr:hypothetical protein L486_06429 [Kwoniella mangroviensis CBS 10435]
MKYLLNFLEGIPDAPNLADPEFQQLLIDVQAGKSSSKSTADAFYDSLEKIVNELKSTPESLAFQKPVSKKDAPDYYEVIKKPMDLTTILRNVKSRKYKNKAEFAADLTLIWENCYEYNSQETHPLRAAARYMKQKAEHHLEYLVDKNEKPANPLQSFLPQGIPLNGSPAPLAGSATTRASGLANDSVTEAGNDEDAAGESDDGLGAQVEEQDFREAGEIPDGGGGKDQEGQSQRSRPGTSVASTSRPRINGDARRSPPAFRPQLNTSLESAPALIRTPYSMTHFMPVSLNQPGPSFSDKGKAKEILYGNAPPSWFPMPSSVTPVSAGYDEEDFKLEGYWWGAMSSTNEDALIGGLPSIPQMVDPVPPKRKRIKLSHRSINGNDPTSSPKKVNRGKPVNMRKTIHGTVNRLHESRMLINRIQEFQRIELEGGILPSRELQTQKEKLIKKEEAYQRSLARQEELERSKERQKAGGEVGDQQAALELKKATAAMLAHSGFEGANETALDLFTRVAVDHLANMGKTFRLLADGFSNKMTTEEIILHALHENGQIETQDLEAHMKDDIERESVKVGDMQRKIRQAFKEVTTAPVIEDDMMFAENGEMLMDGNFADELGEDFLGLRDLGIDKEFGLASLTVPSSLFYGRRRRLAATHGEKEDLPDYPPPPPFIPLSVSSIPTHVPALLHAFYAARMESGLSIIEDDVFDPSHAQIGSLGQIIVKNVPAHTVNNGATAAASANKKKRDRENDDALRNGNGNDGDDDEEKKKKSAVKKPVIPGVGKGNWVRPSKEEKARRLAQKAALIQDQESLPNELGLVKANGVTNGDGQEEDAEGEEE